MSRKEMIEDTLSLNEGVPLFDFNVNFTALKGLLVQFNIQLNSQKEEIDELRMHLRTKADRESVLSALIPDGNIFRIAQRSHEPFGR